MWTAARALDESHKAPMPDPSAKIQGLLFAGVGQQFQETAMLPP